MLLSANREKWMDSWFVGETLLIMMDFCRFTGKQDKV